MSDLLRAHPELKVSVRDIMSRSPSLFDSGSVGGLGLVEGKTVQERWKLLKNVTRLTIYMKQAQRRVVPTNHFHCVNNTSCLCSAVAVAFCFTDLLASMRQQKQEMVFTQ